MTRERQEVSNVVLELNRPCVARERAGFDERVTDDIVEVSEYGPDRLEGREEHMRGIDATPLPVLSGPTLTSSEARSVNLLGEAALVPFYFDQEIKFLDGAP